jgi:NADH-quinone oxidoreductase subunit E
MAQKLIWTDKEQQKVNEAIDEFKGDPGPLIPVLQEVQALFGYLPAEAIEQIAKMLRIPRVEIFAVATFYAQFAFEPRGRHTILSCQGTACHVRGGSMVLEEIKRELNVQEGKTTQDRRFTLEKVYCVGCCSLAPTIIVDERAYGKLVPGKTKEILAKYD